jgi:CRISPR-associated protein Cas6
LDQGVGIQAITGAVDRANHVIRLTDLSQLRIRLPTNLIPLIYPLAGQALAIGKHKFRLGVPQTCLLQPFRNLYARIVVIKGYQEAEGFLQAAQRQLDQLGLQGKLQLATRADGINRRKTIKVNRYTVSGFGLEVFDLSDEDSIKLQILGLGGKRKMGCGIFVPKRRSTHAATP